MENERNMPFPNALASLLLTDWIEYTHTHGKFPRFSHNTKLGAIFFTTVGFSMKIIPFIIMNIKNYNDNKFTFFSRFSKRPYLHRAIFSNNFP